MTSWTNMMLKMLMFLSILFLRIDFSFGVWRYTNNMKDEEFFNIADRVFLMYAEKDLVEWLYPKACTVNNKSAPFAMMTCKSYGFHKVQPVVSTGKEEYTRYLYIKDSVFSFAWYAIMPINRSSPDTFLETVRMWVFAPEQADKSEIEQKALKPSTLSKYLTKQFFNLGQYPEILLLSKEIIHGHFHKDGYWEAVIPGNRKYYNFDINAQPINFQHRFIISNQHNFYWLEEEKPYSGQEVSLRLSPGSRMIVVSSTCKSYRTILLSELGCFYTPDAFKSYEELKVEPGLVPVPPEGYFTVDESALLEDGILFLINSTLYWWDVHLRTLTTPPSLSLDPVKGIYQRTSCVKYYPLQGMELGTLLAWEDHRLLMGSARFEGSQGRYFQPLLVLPPDTTILTASFGSQPVTLACLVLNTSPGSPSHPSLLIYNLVDKAWKTSPFLTKFKEGKHPVGPFRMHFLRSAMNALLLWTDHTIIYSFRNDNDWGELLLPDGRNVHQASGGSKIHQVSLDQIWNMLVKMENNKLFYCKVGMRELVALPSWRGALTRNVIYMDQKDQFTPIIQSPDGKLSEQMYPLLMETKSSMHMTHHSCPFITFKNSMTALAYYMDKGDSIKMWAHVVCTEGKGVHVILLNNNRHLLTMSQKSHSEVKKEVATLNMTITIRQKVNYENVKSYSALIKRTSGVMTMELLPNQIGNTCDLLANRVSYFHVGCPPKRHIRVRRPWGFTCEMKTLRNYTIPRDVLRNHSKDFLGEDLVVDYDWEKFGCLLKLHYSTEFNPHLDLYDGDTFIKSVDANYIIWEIFGRNDYSLNTTMRQMDCLSEAQTWNSMLTEGKSLETAWGPKNYRSCFTVVPDELGDLDQPYEILNQSSGNYLTFSQVDSAIYVFRVKILDPNYSFCDLTAVFAVQTFGISIPKYEHLTVYVALIFTFLSLCILGYSYCRYVKIFRKVLAARKMKDE